MARVFPVVFSLEKLSTYEHRPAPAKSKHCSKREQQAMHPPLPPLCDRKNVSKTPSRLCQILGFDWFSRPPKAIPRDPHQLTHTHPHNQGKYRRLNPVERNQILHLTVRCVRQEPHERVWESFGARWRWHKSISFRACTETQPYDPGAVKCLYRMGWSYQK